MGFILCCQVSVKWGLFFKDKKRLEETRQKCSVTMVMKEKKLILSDSSYISVPPNQ